MTPVADLQRQLDASRAELQEFTYAVSHDLRAPLRHIMAFAQFIEEDLPGAPPDILAHLATIRASAQLLTSQLDGLTQLARLELIPVKLQPVELAALAQTVANELTVQHPQTAVQWQLTHDVPLVLADAALLRLVLVQVLHNALKFSRSSTPAHVALTWRTVEAGRCQIRITDKGIGFAPGQADKLFKVFGKLHSARDFPGLGLGLLNCRKMMQRLGGSIDIAGMEAGGCCVTLTLALVNE